MFITTIVIAGVALSARTEVEKYLHFFSRTPSPSLHRPFPPPLPHLIVFSLLFQVGIPSRYHLLLGWCPSHHCRRLRWGDLLLVPLFTSLPSLVPPFPPSISREAILFVVYYSLYVIFAVARHYYQHSLDQKRVQQYESLREDEVSPSVLPLSLPLSLPPYPLPPSLLPPSFLIIFFFLWGYLGCELDRYR